MDEFELIGRFFKRRGGNAVVGIGDDAAVIDPTPGTHLHIAVDTLVAGRHFPHGLCPGAIGHRAVVVNLSDIAAMGATPRWATLALTLPGADETWLEAFAGGFMSACDKYSVELIGGDTTRGPLTISVQILGEAPAGSTTTRAGAIPGDDIYVSGALGDAAAGLKFYETGSRGDNPQESRLIEKFLWPSPRLDLVAELSTLAHAAIDISDGLLADLGHILSVSDCAAELWLERIPVSAELRALHDPDTVERLSLSGGDDYELCFTAPAHTRDRFRAADVTRVGKLLAGTGLRLTRNGRALDTPAETGYRHFPDSGTPV